MRGRITSSVTVMAGVWLLGFYGRGEWIHCVVFSRSVYVLGKY